MSDEPKPPVATAVATPVATPVEHSVAAARPPPNGAPAGGVYTTENYIGMSTLITVLVLVLIFWPALFGPLCCPCDTREVYMVGGQKFNAATGAVLMPGPCGCNC